MIQVIANPDGSYQWVAGTFTDADIAAANAAPDAVAWIEANAEVVIGQAPTTSEVAPP